MNRARWEWPLLIVVLGLSLVLRLQALDLFLSSDETKWLCRGINFHTALAQGDLKGTYQAEHPGVVTLWISALAVPLSQAGEWVDLCAQTGGRGLTSIEDHAMLARLPSLIFRARRLLAVVTWLGLIGIWWLSRRLFDERTALLGAIFIGLDPFYLALSRVLHLDALLTTFMCLSVLSLLVYLQGSHQRRYLALSAVTGGLAMANKSPALFLAPWTGLVLLAFAWPRTERHTREGLWKALKDTVLWSVVAVSVVALIWPTLWVQPLAALSRVLGQALEYAREPHSRSNFFWGAIRPDPGPAFYPVVWAFRTPPWVMLGLLLALLGWRSRKKHPFPHSTVQSVVLVLGGFALLYTAFMTLGAKKGDRYLLPIFPFVDLLAASGWAALSIGHYTTRNIQLATLLTLILLVAQFAVLWPSRPYYFSYYNPLLGGARAAQRILEVGWGEGMERAAHYLNQKPEADQFHVNVTDVPQFAPFFRGHTSGISDLDLAESDYYVFYINSLQRFQEPEVLGRFYHQVEPEKIIRVQGTDYVWIYPNTLYRPALDYIEARANPLLDVILLDVRSALLRHYEGPLPLVLVQGTMSEDDIIRKLSGVARGRSRVWYLTFSDLPGDWRGLIHRHLEAQADLVEEAAFEGMRVACYELHDDAHFTVPAPTVRYEVRLGDHIRFLGYDLPQPELSRDQPLAVTLYWQATAPLTTSYTVFTHLLGPDGQLWGQLDSIPQSGTRPTTIWLPGETIVDHDEIPLRPGAPQGDYVLAVGLYDFQTGERLPVFRGRGQYLAENRIVIEGLSLLSSAE